MTNEYALNLARYGKFAGLTETLLHTPSKSDENWRNKILTVHAIEAYKHLHGLPNEFKTFTDMCMSKEFKTQCAPVFTNMSVVYPADAKDLIVQAESHVHKESNKQIIQLNKALYTKSLPLINKVIGNATDMYTLAQALAVKGILKKNKFLTEKGIELLFRIGCISDIIWLRQEIENNKKR